MANQINISSSLQLTGPGVTFSGSSSTSGTQVGTNGIEATSALSTTTSQISVGAVTTIGYLFIKNMDPTNNVRIGLATPVTSGNAVVTLQPGEGTVIPTRQTVWYGIAVAGTPQVLTVAVEL